MGQQQQQQPNDVHPMVPVPDAIRTVIRETCRILLEQDAKNPTTPLTVSSESPWSEILGHVLDKDVLMMEPGYPPYNASIMDGYAIRTSEAAQRKGNNQQIWTHHVVDNVYAGDEAAPPRSGVDTKTDGLPFAYYITTGAVVPDTYNCVVPIEECQVSEDKRHIRIESSATIHNQKWIRSVGCDIPTGSVVLPAGHVMDPVALGLLKQSGADSIQIKRPIQVGILSTGNELIVGSNSKYGDVAAPAVQPGKIPDVNRPILLNLIQSFGNCETVDLGMERDDNVKVVAQTIDNALDKCDVIITTGGISMGESDIVEQALVDHCGGTLHFGRMHMKPGKPTTFVTIPKKDRIRLVFAMPGNPVSATVCTQLLVKPCLDMLFHGGVVDSAESSSGGDLESKLTQIVDNALIHPEITVKLAHDIKLDQQRPEYARVTLQRFPDGSYEACTTGVQRSSRLMSCRDAQGLLVLPVGNPSKPKALKGEAYNALLLGSFRGMHQTRVQDSVHLKKKGKEFRVAVVEVLPKDKENQSSLDATCERVKDGLSGSKSGSVRIVSQRLFTGSLDELCTFVIESNDADFIVVSCVMFEGSFQFHLDVSATLKNHLEKPADALALQARQGASYEDPTAALFEVVVGYAPEKQGAMVVCLSDRGVNGGLGNIHGLLKHALNVARGKPHNHHHTHKHHEHATS